MEWTEALRSAIGYMEEHLLEPITLEDVAAHVYLSPLYLQQGFRIVTGYSITRYLRCRRLYLAALDLAAGRGRVIDAALRYGFETPESFTKAFIRFHGASPTQIKQDRSRIKTFFPLKITVSVQGGTIMEYKVRHREGFQIVGFQREFSFESNYQDIPKFWDEFAAKYMDPLLSGKQPETPQEKAVCQYRIGEYGVCIDDGSGTPGTFRYLIAGTYDGKGEVSQGMEVFQFPDLDWAQFPCRGPLPGALQSVNTQIFQEWLPGNQEYEMAMPFNIEWYSSGSDGSDPDYESEIWIPVKKK